MICREHGPWSCNPSNHIHKSSPRGCPDCGGSRHKTTVDFIHRAREVHGELYDYGEVEYFNAHTPVTIFCALHGPFQQTSTSHLSGAGCKQCATTSNFDRVREGSLSSVKKRLLAKTDNDVSIIDEQLQEIKSYINQYVTSDFKQCGSKCGSNFK